MATQALPDGFVESVEMDLQAMVRKARVLEMAYMHVLEASGVRGLGKVRG